nr:immunoglobulin heavy chain junction region [Macaca mulatta]MOY21561.1 immunoglobulin heavy chain junction region [Macaca mulatta]MOY23824.1 immunoglobulin heavy chain junction region [Macaca mulatta]MOY23854.1 immunoglobulin heavy chain junction region [Macaca mulatta]MOY25568.1 immunoglobulin heavy chain junction region [Macaca mulatta]
CASLHNAPFGVIPPYYFDNW